jgi:hypothetical protein
VRARWASSADVALGLIDRVVPENPGGVIYGVIVIGALLAAESGRHEGYADTLGSALLATGLYWLAHAYAALVGGRVTAGARLSATELARSRARLGDRQGRRDPAVRGACSLGGGRRSGNRRDGRAVVRGCDRRRVRAPRGRPRSRHAHRARVRPRRWARRSAWR